MSTSAFVSRKRFVCRVYDSKTSIEGLNVLRYRVFTKSHTSSDKLPHTVDSLKQYIMRANYQSYIWYNADKPILNLRGWTLTDDKELIPLMMTKPPAPAAFSKLSERGCKRNCGSNRCKCKKVNLCFANVALNNVPIVILINKVTLVMKIVTKA